MDARCKAQAGKWQQISLSWKPRASCLIAVVSSPVRRGHSEGSHYRQHPVTATARDPKRERNLSSGVLLPSGCDKIHYKPRDGTQELCVFVCAHVFKDVHGNGSPRFSVEITVSM